MLLNTPAISQCEGIALQLNEVRRGDLFLAESQEEAFSAVENGAYAVLVPFIITLEHSESAWIHVKDREDGLMRIFRYLLLNTPHRFYYTNAVQFEILSHIHHPKTAVFLKSDIDSVFKQVLSAPEETVFISENKTLLQNINPSCKSVHSCVDENDITATIQTHSVFHTTFYCKEHSLYDQKFPSLYANDLFIAVLFLKHLKMKFDLKRATYPQTFYPVFINRQFEIQPFGKSERVLIFNTRLEEFHKGYTYLQKIAPWAKCIFLLPEHCKNTLAGDLPDIHYFDNSDAAIALLSSISFHFAHISGRSAEDFGITESKYKQPGLFEDVAFYGNSPD